MPLDLKFRTLAPGAYPEQLIPDDQRKAMPFQQGIDDTMGRLRSELEKLGVDEAFVAIATTDLLKDGSRPHSLAKPYHPGIVVTAYSRRHGVLTWACDNCRRWDDNVRAIALTIERLRLADIYKVTKGRQYKGFAALPASTGLNTPEEALRVIAEALGITTSEVRVDLPAAIRRAMKVTHPDRAGEGSRDRYAKVERAKAILENRATGSTLATLPGTK